MSRDAFGSLAPAQIDVMDSSGRHEIGVHGWIHERNATSPREEEERLLRMAVERMSRPDLASWLPGGEVMAPRRRDVLKTSGVAGVAALVGGTRDGLGAAFAQTEQASSPTMRRVETSVLEIAYEQSGDGAGFPIILLHGFPYDVRAWDGTLTPLADAGYRVLVPYLRGYGPTRFRDTSAVRMAEQAAIAQDVVDFADALNLDRFALAGFDWGNRAACITSILHPDRVRAQVAVNGYSVQNTVTPSPPASAAAEARLWYQWYFNTERGRVGLEANRRDICRYLWSTWSPGWQFTDEIYERSAVSFDNPDFVDVVIHSYRHRHGNALGEGRFVAVERDLAERPPVTVPAIVLRGDASGFGRPSPDPTADQDRFTSLVARRIVEGAGHDLPAQRPDAVVAALRELLA